MSVGGLRRRTRVSFARRISGSSCREVSYDAMTIDVQFRPIFSRHLLRFDAADDAEEARGAHFRGILADSRYPAADFPPSGEYRRH